MHRSAFSPLSFLTGVRLISLAISLLMLLGMVLAVLAPAPAIAQAAPQAGSVDVGRVRFEVETNGFTDAAGLADLYGAGVTTAWDQFSSLFGAEPVHTPLVRFLVAPDPAATARMMPVGPGAWAAPDGLSGVVTIEPFLALSPLEADNILRNVLSRAFMCQASGARMPLTLADGIARYVELPVLARQARLGSLVQGLDQAGTRPPMAEVLDGTTTSLDAETTTALRYALVAFVTERYGVATMQALVQGFATQPDWRVLLPQVLGQSVEDLDAAWTAFLPRWFSAGWRENAVSAFDLSRAESLFERGAYEAASAEASRSQQLFSDLGDQPMLSRVEGLLAQSAVGLQADGTMRDVQTALETHDYIRAGTLLDEAERLYASLPESHRPAEAIASYRSIGERGQDAVARLDEARANAGSWLNVRQARADALAAGTEFAKLGDADRLAEASGLVTSLDRRLQRLVLGLTAISVLTAFWLAVWIWFRAPARLGWGSRGRIARPRRSLPGAG